MGASGLRRIPGWIRLARAVYGSNVHLRDTPWFVLRFFRSTCRVPHFASPLSLRAHPEPNRDDPLYRIIETLGGPAPQFSREFRNPSCRRGRRSITIVGRPLNEPRRMPPMNESDVGDRPQVTALKTTASHLGSLGAITWNARRIAASSKIRRLRANIQPGGRRLSGTRRPNAVDARPVLNPDFSPQSHREHRDDRNTDPSWSSVRSARRKRCPGRSPDRRASIFSVGSVRLTLRILYGGQDFRFIRIGQSAGLV
jgi:hypothetical protein